jgi:hypothetical protein
VTKGFWPRHLHAQHAGSIGKDDARLQQLGAGGSCVERRQAQEEFGFAGPQSGERAEREGAASQFGFGGVGE